MKKDLLTIVVCSIIMTLGFLIITSDAKAETNTVTSTVSGTVTGTTTIDRTPSTAMAPNIMINQNDMCKSGVGAGVQSSVIGLALGATVVDDNCERIKLSRQLYQMGMKVAAVSALCQDARVFDAMMMAGTPCPYDGKIGKEALQLWKVNEDKVPAGTVWKAEANVKLLPSNESINIKVKNDRPSGAVIQPYKKPEPEPAVTEALPKEPEIQVEEIKYED